MDELLGGEKQENPEKEAPAEIEKGISSEEVAAIVRTEIAKIPQPQPVKKTQFLDERRACFDGGTDRCDPDAVQQSERADEHFAQQCRFGSQ